jgi:hypothetical protein
MSRIYNQESQRPDYDYNRGFSHGYDYAAHERKQQDALWEWWEHERDLLNQELRDDADAFSVVVFEDGYRIHDQMKRRH